MLKFTMLISAIILMLLGTSAFAGNPADEACTGLTGPAKGLCTAAFNLGCGTEAEINSNACASIEENYLKLTGEMPPWLAFCPCFTTEFILEEGEIVECIIQTPIIPDGGAFQWPIGFGCTGTACFDGNVLSCGIGPTSLGIIQVSPITEDENAACLSEIVAACAVSGN